MSEHREADQTIPVGMNRRLEDLADIVADSEEANTALVRSDFTPAEWVVVVDFILTKRGLPGRTPEEIALVESTGDLSPGAGSTGGQ